MDTEFSGIRKQINIVYYALYVMYILLVLIFGYLLRGSDNQLLLDPLSKAGQTISYVVIMYVLVSVPGALWLFKRAMKKVSAMEGEAQQKKYTEYAVMRVCAIGLGAILAIVAFYILGSYQPMLWCAGIAIVAQFFCKPSDRKIYLEMNNKSEEEL